jgi:hypothetical protein
MLEESSILTYACFFPLLVHVYVYTLIIRSRYFLIKRTRCHFFFCFFSTLSVLCWAKNFWPINKNLAHFAHRFFQHKRSSPIGLKILVAPLKLIVSFYIVFLLTSSQYTPFQFDIYDNLFKKTNSNIFCMNKCICCRLRKKICSIRWIILIYHQHN